MRQMIYNLIGSLIMFYSNLFVWSKFLNIKIDYKSIKFYISWVLLSIICIVNAYLFTDFFKIITITLAYMIFIKIYFKVNYSKSIITPVFSQVLVMVCELIAFLILVTVLKLNIEGIKDKFMSTIFINVLISMIFIIISCIPFIKKNI